MGRWSYSNRTEADYLKKIEIWWLKRYGYLNRWKSGSILWKNIRGESSIGISVTTMNDENYLRFWYTQTDDDGTKQDFDYKVQLTTTTCRYGGRRYWFICPLVKAGVYCGRRVGVLYKDGNYFGCRHCYDLTYSSRKKNQRYKMHHLFRVLDTQIKTEKIRENMKRSFYAGKPTRKMRRIMRLHRDVKPFLDTLMERDKKGML